MPFCQKGGRTGTEAALSERAAAFLMRLRGRSMASWIPGLFSYPEKLSFDDTLRDVIVGHY